MDDFREWNHCQHCNNLLRKKEAFIHVEMPKSEMKVIATHSEGI
jgi:hypothetical protein